MIRRALAAWTLVAGAATAQITPGEAVWCAPAIMIGLVEAAPTCGWNVAPVARVRATAMVDQAAEAAGRLHGSEGARRMRGWLLNMASRSGESVCRTMGAQGQQMLDMLAAPAGDTMVEAWLIDARRATTLEGSCL